MDEVGGGTRRGGTRHVGTRSGWTSREVARTFKKKEYDIDSASGPTRSGERGRASEARCGEGRTASIIDIECRVRRDRWCDVAMACGARLRRGLADTPFKRGATKTLKTRASGIRAQIESRARSGQSCRRLADESSILRARASGAPDPPRVSKRSCSVRVLQPARLRRPRAWCVPVSPLRFAEEEFRAGPGTYVRDQHVVAAVVGTARGPAEAEAEDRRPVVEVVRQGRAALPLGTVTARAGGSLIPQVGDEVFARVARVNPRQCRLHDVMTVNGQAAEDSFSGLSARRTCA